MEFEVFKTMFSNLGHIFFNRPRHAESADARLGIRRHDPDQDGRRKKEDGENSGSEFDRDDSATVTVEALRIFLENFLQSITPAAQNVEKNFSAQSAGQNHQPRHIDGETAKAVGAYGRTAQKNEHKNEKPITPTVSAPDTGAATGLNAGEIRAIHGLLADLPELTARGIEYITIERGESFLASLVNAVEKAKNS